MTMLKSLLLGSAAGLVAVAGAQAADLPAKAKAVEYVKVCDAYGAGFYYIPGTDTCLRVGGALRADYYVQYRAASAPPIGDVGSDGIWGRNDNLTSARVRAYMEFDARTRTEYGTLRSYAQPYITYTSGQSAVTTGNSVTNGNADIFLNRAFIQFAGFTFGYVQSFFDYSTGLGTFATLNVGSNHTNIALAYTASFGNGLSATIAAEDNTYRRQDIGYTTATINTGGTAIGWAGQAMPDILGILRVDQSWGSAQLAGVVHQLRSIDPGVDTDYGWAIGAGITFNLDMIAKGDQLVIQGSYADGAVDYLGVGGNTTNAGRASLAMGSAAPVIADIADAYINGASLDTVTGWTTRVDFRHFWTPSLRTTLFGGYTSIETPTVGGVTYGAFARDFNIWHVGVNTTWSPVKNLDIGVELLYTKLDAKSNVYGAGEDDWNPSEHADAWVGMLRVQRNF